MSLRVSSTAAESPGSAHPGDGQRLAASLRTNRLTTLYGTAGSGKSTLLRNDVLPMLHRRATDMAVAHGRTARVVIPFADRRRGPTAWGGVRGAEVAVLFDDWSPAPLARLLGRIHEAMGTAAPESGPAGLSLAGSLAALNMQFGARFLIILDQFEEGVAATEHEPSAREFLDQLVQTLNRPLLPVNFLIAVREEARALLDSLRTRVPGFDDRSLQLGDLPEARAPLRRVPAAATMADAPEAEGPTASAAPAEAPAALERHASETAEEWYQSIGAIVQRAAVAARRDELPKLNVKVSVPGAAVGPPRAESPAGFAEQVTPPNSLPESPPVWPAAATPASPESLDAGGPDAAAAEPSPPDFTIDWRKVLAADERDDPPLPVAATEPTRATTLTAEQQADEDDDESPPPAISAPAPVAKKKLPRKTELAVWVIAGLVFVGYGAWVVVAPGGEPAELVSAVSPKLSSPATTATHAPATPPAPVPAPFSVPVPASVIAPVATPQTVAARATLGLDATPRPLTELAGTLALASPAGARGAAAPRWPAGFSALPGAPQFAVARYDALQAARFQTVKPLLQVITPLYLDPVYFIARADSPMTYIHDIEAAAIDAGAAESSRAVTAGAIYLRLFGKSLPKRAGAAGADVAIGQLLAGKGVDVVVLAGSQPSAWLAGMPPATARALKLLKLDRNSAADQRALQAYLPSTLRAGPAQGTPSLGVMSFLVTADAEAGVVGVNALCAALPALQQSGDPVWRELQPGLQLEAGWPASLAAQQAWHDCAPRSP